MNPQHPCWAFMWAHNRPFITSIIGWTRKDVIENVQNQIGKPWKKIYREGGRIVKISISLK